MKIIPAIDIRDKKVVRLEQGEFDKEKIYLENPILAAKRWKAEGAELLHVVDLDGAKIGQPVNLDVIEEIKKAISIEIELGGGLRVEKDIENAFKAGVLFVVVGTSAVRDESFCKMLIDKYNTKVAFAVDVKDAKVAIKGWKEVSDCDALEYVKKLEALGAKRIIYTDISRDGMLSGPNLDVLKTILNETFLEVTASGGVSNIEDIKLLKTLEGSGLDGVIIGKALYEGKIKLKEAIDACKENNSVS